jgi:hypothetical protein
MNEATLDEAIQYYHSTDEGLVTMSVKISLKYDGANRPESDTSPLVGKEADFPEIYQGSSREISDPQQAISKVVVKISGPQGD